MYLHDFKLTDADLNFLVEAAVPEVRDRAGLKRLPNGALCGTPRGMYPSTF